MAWQADRPVPWMRMLRDWLVFAVVMVIVFAFFADASASSYVGLVASLPLYLLLGAVLAKFGYSRKTLADLREERVATQEAARQRDEASAPRRKPAPTKRTGGGGNQRPGGKRRR